MDNFRYLVSWAGKCSEGVSRCSEELEENGNVGSDQKEKMNWFVH